jgi:hypothetical protein
MTYGATRLGGAATSNRSGEAGRGVPLVALGSGW